MQLSVCRSSVRRVDDRQCGGVDRLRYCLGTGQSDDCTGFLVGIYVIEFTSCPWDVFLFWRIQA